jgi:pimeloyl-ACP methyl ester carboxylesterase
MTTFVARQTNRITTELASFGRRVGSSSKPAVAIALHCSGSSGRQWSALRNGLGRQIITPDLIGCGSMPHWSGERPFRLADEARPIVTLIDALDARVHLIGHSYGGGVALRVAVERPSRIASLSLYEPTAFHVLRAAGEDGQVALEEIRALAAKIGRHVVTGAYRAAARCFIDYWNGAGTFDALKPDDQANVVRYVPKACLDFGALIEEQTPLVAYRRLRVSLRLMIGQNAPVATELLGRKLAAVMNPGALRVVEGAGHMGPMTHSDLVVKMIIDHIAASDSTAWYPAPLTQRAA